MYFLGVDHVSNNPYKTSIVGVRAGDWGLCRGGGWGLCRGGNP